MKKGIKKIAMLCMIFAITGGFLFAAGAQEAEEVGFEIVALHGSLDNTWRIQMDDQMEKVADRYLEEGLISSYESFTAEGDASLQAQQLSQVVNQGADAVLINPVSDAALFPAIDRAVERGIKVFAIDSTIDHPDVLTVTNDQTFFAEQHIEWFVDAIDGEGNIFWFDAWPGVPASDERTAVWEEYLEDYPDINVLARDHHQWSVATAREKTAQLLAAHDEHIDGVLTMECSAGIVKAFDEAGREMPDAINGGNEMEDLRLWGEHDYSSLMVENPPAVGAHGIMVAVRMLQGMELDSSKEEVTNNTLRLKGNLIITDETRDEWIEKTEDWPSTRYIDTLMTDEEIDEFFL